MLKLISREQKISIKTCFNYLKAANRNVTSASGYIWDMYTLEAKVKRQNFKRCIVYSCKNTTISAPDKVFLSVPSKPEMRHRWSVAVQRDLSSKNIHCCEDHFDLQEDAENWIRYKLTRNVKLRLKKHAVPRVCSLENADLKRVAASKLAQKRLVAEALAAAEKKAVEEKKQQELLKLWQTVIPVNPNSSFVTVLINTDNIETQHFRSEDLRERRQPEKAVQVKPHFRSKGITCCLPMTNKQISSTRKKKKSRGRKRKPPLSIMTVEDGSEDDEPWKPAIMRRAHLRSSSEGLNVANENSDEAQEMHFESCDKAIQAFARPSYRSKAVTCNLPVLPLEKPKIQHQSCDKDISNPPSPKPSSFFTEICLNGVAIESNDKHFSGCNLDYTFMDTSRYSYIFNESYVTICPLREFLPSEETYKQHEKASDNVKQSTLKTEGSLSHELVPMKNIIKKEVDENCIEESLISEAQIKHEIVDADRLPPNNFVDCGIKQEPYFEEFTYSNTSLNY